MVGSTPSLLAEGEQRLPSYFNIDRDIPHEYALDLYEVRRRAQEGLYDRNAVSKLTPMYLGTDEEKPDEQRAEDGARQSMQAGRKGVVITEVWGTLLDQATGDVLMEEGCLVIGNGEILAGPMENPYWHGKRPFVFLEPRRVPGSTKHRGLFDDAAQVNRAANELFNFMIDGGIGSVWGIRNQGGLDAHFYAIMKERNPGSVHIELPLSTVH